MRRVDFAILGVSVLLIAVGAILQASGSLVGIALILMGLLGIAIVLPVGLP